MTAGERRKLVFANLANGVPLPHVMEAFHLSELEVMADFRFIAGKIRSYRFERIMPPIPCDTIAEARADHVELLHTLARINADKDPTFGTIHTLPLEVRPDGRPSMAEAKLMEMRLKAQRAP